MPPPPPPLPADSRKDVHVIGFGAVGQAFYKLLLRLLADKAAGTEGLRRIAFYAPELTERSEEVVGGVTLSKAPCGGVERGTLTAVLDSLGAKPGDILLELATRIDTPTIWEEAKRRGLHFANSGFDCWPDVEQDLEALDELKKHAVFDGRRHQHASATGAAAAPRLCCRPRARARDDSHSRAPRMTPAAAAESVLTMFMARLRKNRSSTHGTRETAKVRKPMSASRMILAAGWSAGAHGWRGTTAGSGACTRASERWSWRATAERGGRRLVAAWAMAGATRRSCRLGAHSRTTWRRAVARSSVLGLLAGPHEVVTSPRWQRRGRS